ncbi:MAG: hypothetical protein AAGD00_07935 [Planctomycetota bacterium]
MLLVVGVSGMAASVAHASTASALFREGDTLPGDATQTITGIGSPDANAVGGYVFQAASEDAAGNVTQSHAIGEPVGLAAKTLRTEGMVAGFNQTAFEFRIGISDSGSLTYSATIDEGDSVFVDDNPILIDGQPFGNDPVNTLASFGSRPGMTANGQPWFIGGVTDSVGGSTQNRFLYIGNQIVLQGGDSVDAGLPNVLIGGSSISFDSRVSDTGQTYISEVNVDTGSSADDNVMVINGQAITLGGTFVQEGVAVPASVGGIGGEAWDNFDNVGINDAGDFLITGDTNGDTATDEFLLVNGQIILRQGDSFAGGTLDASIDAAQMNEAGDWAAIWGADFGSGSLEILMANGQLVVSEGDLVDWNGDGVIDANDQGAVLDDFTGIDELALGATDSAGRFDVFFTADVILDNGDELEGAFRITVPAPGTIAVVGALGFTAGRRRRA